VPRKEYLQVHKLRSIWVAPSEDEKRFIRQAAGLQNTSMAQFVLEAALARAEKVLGLKKPEKDLDSCG